MESLEGAGVLKSVAARYPRYTLSTDKGWMPKSILPTHYATHVVLGSNLSPRSQQHKIVSHSQVSPSRLPSVTRDNYFRRRSFPPNICAVNETGQPWKCPASNAFHSQHWAPMRSRASSFFAVSMRASAFACYCITSSSHESDGMSLVQTMRLSTRQLLSLTRYKNRRGGANHLRLPFISPIGSKGTNRLAYGSRDG